MPFYVDTKVPTANDDDDDEANAKIMIGDNNDQTTQTDDFYNRYHKFSHKINPIAIAIEVLFYYYYNSEDCLRISTNLQFHINMHL